MSKNSTPKSTSKVTSNYANSTKAANSIVTKSKKIASHSSAPLPEFSTECNPDNNAWFEGRSNPLSSKGN